jgi:hypothetical protein
MPRVTFRLLPWRSRSQHDLEATLCLAHNFVIWSWILKLFHRNYQHNEKTCRAQFGLLAWRSRSQHDLEAKYCPSHNCVIWSRILKLFLKNDHQNETTCSAQQLGRYLEGQDHSMTLLQNRVRPITVLFEVRF